MLPFLGGARGSQLTGLLGNQSLGSAPWRKGFSLSSKWVLGGGVSLLKKKKKQQHTHPTPPSSQYECFWHITFQLLPICPSSDARLPLCAVLHAVPPACFYLSYVSLCFSSLRNYFHRCIMFYDIKQQLSLSYWASVIIANMCGTLTTHRPCLRALL